MCLGSLESGGVSCLFQTYQWYQRHELWSKLPGKVLKTARKQLEVIHLIKERQRTVCGHRRILNQVSCLFQTCQRYQILNMPNTKYQYQTFKATMCKIFMSISQIYSDSICFFFVENWSNPDEKWYNHYVFLCPFISSSAVWYDTASRWPQSQKI